MIRLLLAILLLSLSASIGWAQTSGVGGPYFRDDCTTIPAHIANKILCWDQTSAIMKYWDGSAWVAISSGDVTHTGTLTANTFILGNGSTSVKALALTGYVKGNGASAPTASATVPTTDLAGALAAANFPALTGDITTPGASLATTLSSTGVSAGTYGQVTVDVKGRVTAASTGADMAHGGTDVTSAADDAVLVSSGTAWQAKVLTTCTGATKALTYDASANTFGCNTISAGTGSVTNTGTLTANALITGNGGVDVKAVAITGLVKGNGASAPAAYAGTTCANPTYVQSLDANGAATCNTPSGAGDVSHPAGALSANFAVLGDSAGQIKAVSITGYYKGAGASAPSAVTTIPVADGGTNLTSYAVGDLLYASGATTLAKLAAAPLGQVVISQGTATAPIWSPSAFLSTSLRTPLVVGDTSVAGALALRSTSGVGTNDAILFQVGNNGSTEAARITSPGDLGVGTTAPAGKLHVSGGVFIVDSGIAATPALMRFRINGVASNTEIAVAGAANNGFVGTSAGDLYARVAAAKSIHLGVDDGGGTASPVLSVASTGRVGIGTTSPGQKLTVAGLVESTSGGFKFPDATIQTTAANLSGTLTATRIPFVISTSVLGDNAHFVWDNANESLQLTSTAVTNYPPHLVTTTRTAALTTNTFTVDVGDGPAVCCGPAGQNAPIHVSGSLINATTTINIGSTASAASSAVQNVVTLAAVTGAAGSVGQLIYNRFTGSSSSGHLELYGLATQNTIDLSLAGGSPSADANFFGLAAQMFVRAPGGDPTKPATSGTIQGFPCQIVNTTTPSGAGTICLYLTNGVDNATNNLVTASDAMRIIALKGSGAGVEGWTNAIHLKADGLTDTATRFKLVNDGSIFMNVKTGGSATIMDLRRDGVIQFQVDNATSATDLGVLMNYNGTLKRVVVGASDSCGAGFRCLRITN